MDFFQNQEAARRNTRRLVVLFFAAVAAVIVAVNLAVVLIFFGARVHEGVEAPIHGIFRPDLALAVTIATLVVMSGGTLYKIAALSSGGEAVAQLLGGRPVDPATTDAAERRLLNVVEEMALASGTQVPTVYLLDKEEGINAFAAGFSPQHAVVGVTRGTVELLSRDELQGVIAHEFSHVLNGDMRLNLRLIGILHGILVIGLVGYWILRVGPRSSGSRDKKGGGGAAILLLGLALLVIGYVGVFFGKLIKSGLSRQREFLADASAVQFTRNPDGIAGALKKIGGLAAGSKLASPNAEQASHLFFGNGVGKSLFAWMSTHPPLEERIRRIDPRFDGEFPVVELPAAGPTAAAAGAKAAGKRAPVPFPVPLPAGEALGGAGALTGTGGAMTAVILAGAVGAAGAAGAAAAGAAQTQALDPGGVESLVGSPRPAHLAYIAALMDALPAELADGARDPADARAVVAALLLDRDGEVRRRQLDLVAAAGDPALDRRVRELLAAADRCPAAARLPLLDLAVPALRRLSPAQYASFKALIEALVSADNQVSVFEYTLRHLLLRHLEPNFSKAKPAAVQHYSLDRLGDEISVLISALAWAGDSGDGDEAAQAFAAAAGRLPELGDRLALARRESSGLGRLDPSLAKLAATAPRLRQKLLGVAAAAIAYDGRVTLAEGELLRAVADALDCPLPPLLPGETLA